MRVIFKWRPWVGPLLLVAAAGGLRAEPTPIEVDYERSFLVVRLDKGGLFSFFAGHRHGILATDWSADICYDSEAPQSSSVAVRVFTASLRADTDEARAKAQLQEAGPKPEDVQQIQQDMLSEDLLAAGRYPEISFQSESVEQRGEDLRVHGLLRIKGRANPQTIALRVAAAPEGALRFEGEFALRQTRFGIEPVSIAGVVKVKDEVTVLFEVTGKPSEGSCR